MTDSGAPATQERSRSVIHLPDDTGELPVRYAPGWAVSMPGPPAMPPGNAQGRTEPRQAHVLIRWARGLFAAVVLGPLGGVFYVSLAILVGVEIYPAAIVLGILCGAGLRVGGVAPGGAACAVASVLGLASLWLAGAVAQASLTAMATDGDLVAALVPWWNDPITASAGLFAGPMLACVLAALTTAGAVLATLAYGKRDAG
ncbi:hypothetical protein [Demequina flava]|uniref:hypothetical protein n=1 Tax=Demequina flava TaxID=1095025 RepID=UPI000B2509E9|nr:hypothetical protein [Demequina flava]